MSPLAALRALRPQQWVKNLFVLAAWAFALGDPEAGLAQGAHWDALLAFLAFSLGASAIYLVNDVLDVEADRLHPTKCRRPIAAGELAVPAALGLAVALAAGALGLAAATAGAVPLAVVVLAYMVMNLLYSLRLKRIVLVDVFCIAAGFLFRVEGGALAVDVQVSRWLLLCTLFLALFLALNKRRAELAALGSGSATRASLQGYTLALCDQLVTMIAACTIVSYALYTVDPATVAKYAGGERLIYSVPFVVFGLARYLQLVQTRGKGESPTRILLGGDRLFAIDLAAWAAVILWATQG